MVWCNISNNFKLSYKGCRWWPPSDMVLYLPWSWSWWHNRSGNRIQAPALCIFPGHERRFDLLVRGSYLRWGVCWGFMLVATLVLMRWTGLGTFSTSFGCQTRLLARRVKLNPFNSVGLTSLSISSAWMNRGILQQLSTKEFSAVKLT
jgi:hypothetical protein